MKDPGVLHVYSEAGVRETSMGDGRQRQVPIVIVVGAEHLQSNSHSVSLSSHFRAFATRCSLSASVRRVITQRRLSQASRGVGTRAPLTYNEPITFCFAQSKTSQFREYVRGRLKGSGPELTSNVTGISERELKPQLTLVTRSLVNRFRYCTHRCFITS